MNRTLITYPYNDEHNNLLYSKIRIEENGNKSFYYERIENGKIVKNLNDCRKVLYRLPKLLEGISQKRFVCLVEGEKDVETLLRYGLIATTTTGSLEWSEEYTELLKNEIVIIFYDNDRTGLKRKVLLCQNLYGKVKQLKIIDLPGLDYSESHGQDITDWLRIPGNDLDQLIKLIGQTPDYQPKEISHTAIEKSNINSEEMLRTVSIAELLSLELPPREMLLAPFLPTQGLVMIVAKRGVGKTHIALGIAYAVATAGTFLCWDAPIARRVLYVDGEMPASLMQERLRHIVAMFDKTDDKGYLQLLTPDLQGRPLPDLSCKEGRNVIESLLNNVDLIVIDNISCLFRSGSENESESWQEAQEWALDLRRRGKSILFVHHAGKSGIQRGTSKREDILDCVIILKHPDDYKAQDGARFEVSFDKARHFSGEKARPFLVQLHDENGNWHWEISNTSEEALIEEIANMKLIGHTIQLIAQKKRLTKSQVETLIAKAKVKGLLN
jgi:KaiC/GvpD/RAD55 family RecA-like ATPase